MLSDLNTYCWFGGLRVFIPITFLMVQSSAESMKDFKGMSPESHGVAPAAHSSHGDRPPAVSHTLTDTCTPRRNH